VNIGDSLEILCTKRLLTLAHIFKLSENVIRVRFFWHAM